MEISRPASAGPTIRELVISALLRLTAFCTLVSGTISTTNARRAGLSKAVAMPPQNATAKIATTGGLSMKASPASTNDCSMANACTIIRSRRLSLRSAIRPAQAPNSRTGANWQPVSSPTIRPLLVSFRTSSVWAIRVSQLPTWLMICPEKNSRKLRYLSELNVDPPRRERRPLAAGSCHSSTGTASSTPGAGTGGGFVGGTTASVPKIG